MTSLQNECKSYNGPIQSYYSDYEDYDLGGSSLSRDSYGGNDSCDRMRPSNPMSTFLLNEDSGDCDHYGSDGSLDYNSKYMNEEMIMMTSMSLNEIEDDNETENNNSPFEHHRGREREIENDNPEDIWKRPMKKSNNNIDTNDINAMVKDQTNSIHNRKRKNDTFSKQRLDGLIGCNSRLNEPSRTLSPKIEEEVRVKREKYGYNADDDRNLYRSRGSGSGILQFDTSALTASADSPLRPFKKTIGVSELSHPFPAYFTTNDMTPPLGTNTEKSSPFNENLFKTGVTDHDHKKPLHLI